MLTITWIKLREYLFGSLSLDRSQEINYHSRFKKISGYFSTKEFNRDTIQAFLYELKKDYSPSTVGLYLLLIKHICNYLNLDYCNGMKTPKRGRVYNPTLSSSQMRQVLELAYRLNYRLALALEMSMRYGFRIGTVRNLQWKNVFEDHVIIREQKDNIDKPKYIDKDIYEKLQQLRKWDEYVFSAHNGQITGKALNSFLRDLLKRLNITQYMTFHDLRHSCATVLHDNGVDIRYIQEQLDHKNITTTEYYTHVSLESLKKVLKKHPLSLKSLRFEDISERLRELSDLFKQAGYRIELLESEKKIYFTIEDKEYVYAVQ